jgi:PAS domain S-box-containing protein
MEAGPEVDDPARWEGFLPESGADVLRLLGAWSIPFALLNASDRILFWNRGASQLYGKTEDEVLGKGWGEVTGEEAALPMSVAPGLRTRRYEARHKSASGVELPVMVTRTDLPPTHGEEGAFVLVTDLSDSKVLERRLARRVAQLSVLREISECLQSAMGLELILRTILVGATASQGLRFNRAFLMLVNERRGVLEGRDVIGPKDADEAQRIWSRLAKHDRTLRELVDEYEPVGEGGDSGVRHVVERLSAPLGDEESFVVAALNAAGTTRVVQGRRAEGEGPSPEAVAGILGVDTFVAVPLRTGTRPVGLLLADNAITLRGITDEDVDMLELLGFQAAHAIERAGLTGELARKVASLEEATQELRKNQDRLVQAERLSAIGEMAARVAHEIRNPLVAIGGFARGLLQRSPHPDESTRESLEIIVDEVRRLEAIVREVLEFSRPLSPKIGPVDLRKLAAEAVELLRWELDEAQVRVAIGAAAAARPAAADRDQIFQALVNVLRNAIHAMPRGGTLALDVRALPHGVELVIRDSGIGMPPEVLARVLEPFYTTKTNGSGLGLTIATQIVRDHHGELKIDSREGEGTTVTFRLPAAEEDDDGQDPGD